MIDKNTIKSAIKSKLGTGIIWNMFSLVFVVFSGVVIMFLYPASAFGDFDVAFAYYTAMSQVTVLGIHISVMKYSSEYHQDKSQLDRMVTAGLLDTLIVSIASSIVFAAVAMLLNRVWPSDLMLAILNSIPALVFFSLNKVLLNYLNGLSLMKEYAVFQALRAIFLVCSLVILAVLKSPVYLLTLCYLISELLLFIILTVYMASKKLMRLKYDSAWMREHLKFGLRIIPGNLVQVLNVRMSAICLRFFLGSSPLVGYYSFAANIAEGFDQMLLVVRRNINPLITQHYMAGDENAFYRLYRNVRKYLRIGTPPTALLIVGVVALGCFMIPELTKYLASLLPMSIILLSLCINSAYVSYQNALSQTGFPSAEAIVNITVLCLNIAGNILLIPVLGIVGASISTALSYTILSVVLYRLMKKRTGYELKFIG